MARSQDSNPGGWIEYSDSSLKQYASSKPVGRCAFDSNLSLDQFLHSELLHFPGWQTFDREYPLILLAWKSDIHTI